MYQCIGDLTTTQFRMASESDEKEEDLTFSEKLYQMEEKESDELIKWSEASLFLLSYNFGNVEGNSLAVYDICRLQTADRRPQTADCKLSAPRLTTALHVFLRYVS